MQKLRDSIKLAKHQKADTVSAFHVEQASNNLIHVTREGFYRHLGMIGGVLLGASLSALLTMISTKQCSTTAVIISTVLSIIGLFIVSLHIAKDLL